jgi:hypothetical protein
MYVEAQEVVDCELGHHERDLVFTGCEDEVGRVPGLQPLLELAHAHDILEEVGDHLSHESLEFFNFVDIPGVLVVSGVGRVLHLFASVFDEASRRVVAHNRVVILGPAHVITDLRLLL